MNLLSIYLTALILFVASDAYPQEENYFRRLIKRPLFKPESDLRKYKWTAYSPYYQVELDNKIGPESFVVEKKDGEDWLHLFNSYKQLIKSFELIPNGSKSRIYRLAVRKLSAETKLILIYYYEGNTDYLYFNGTARVYFLTIDNNDFSTISFYKGPAIWEETKNTLGYYHQRKYAINLFDFNNDGVREVIAKYHLNTYVYSYKKGGKWETL